MTERFKFSKSSIVKSILMQCSGYSTHFNYCSVCIVYIDVYYSPERFRTLYYSEPILFLNAKSELFSWRFIFDGVCPALFFTEATARSVSVPRRMLHLSRFFIVNQKQIARSCNVILERMTLMSRFFWGICKHTARSLSSDS